MDAEVLVLHEETKVGQVVSEWKKQNHMTYRKSAGLCDYTDDWATRNLTENGWYILRNTELTTGVVTEGMVIDSQDIYRQMLAEGDDLTLEKLNVIFKDVIASKPWLHLLGCSVCGSRDNEVTIRFDVADEDIYSMSICPRCLHELCGMMVIEEE